jgi:adenine-specific DNA-methyltransferase
MVGAEDLKVGLEREIKEIDRQIKEVRRATTGAVALEEKLAGQKQIKSLEAMRGTKRRSLFDAQDEIDRSNRSPRPLLRPLSATAAGLLR